MNSEIKQQNQHLLKEAKAVSVVFKQNGVDSPNSHWSVFCSACVVIPFRSIPEQRNLAFKTACESLEKSKSEVREWGLDPAILNNVETELVKLGDILKVVSAEASESSTNNMKI